MHHVRRVQKLRTDLQSIWVEEGSMIATHPIFSCFVFSTIDNGPLISLYVCGSRLTRPELLWLPGQDAATFLVLRTLPLSLAY